MHKDLFESSSIFFLLILSCVFGLAVLGSSSPIGGLAIISQSLIVFGYPFLRTAKVGRHSRRCPASIISMDLVCIAAAVILMIVGRQELTAMVRFALKDGWQVTTVMMLFFSGFSVLTAAFVTALEMGKIFSKSLVAR
jgi:hypothetical protein